MSRHKNPLPLTPHANVNVSVHDKVLPGKVKPFVGGHSQILGSKPFIVGNALTLGLCCTLSVLMKVAVCPNTKFIECIS